MNHYIVLVSCLLYISTSCNNAKDIKNNHQPTERQESPFIPKKVGDTLVYVGHTYYSDLLDNYDTSYSDTIKLFQLHVDSLCFMMKQVKYKEIPHYEGQKFDDVTLVEIIYRFAMNDSNTFYLEYISDYYKQKTLTRYCCEDSLYLIETIDRASENKKEDRTFNGKLLK